MGCKITNSNRRTWKITSNRLCFNYFKDRLARFYGTVVIANNSSHLNSFKYIMQYSLYKTFARKYSTTARKIIAKYRHHKDFAVFYEDKKGGKKMRVFFNGSFKRKTTAMDASCDYVANTIFNTTVSSLIQRLKAGKCELCGATENIEIHHVKRLKDLKGKEPWKIQMIGRQRKTLAVCIPCHNKIHHGIIDWIC